MKKKLNNTSKKLLKKLICVVLLCILLVLLLKVNHQNVILNIIKLGCIGILLFFLTSNSAD